MIIHEVGQRMGVTGEADAAKSSEACGGYLWWLVVQCRACPAAIHTHCCQSAMHTAPSQPCTLLPFSHAHCSQSAMHTAPSQPCTLPAVFYTAVSYALYYTLYVWKTKLAGVQHIVVLCSVPALYSTRCVLMSLQHTKNNNLSLLIHTAAATRMRVWTHLVNGIYGSSRSQQQPHHLLMFILRCPVQGSVTHLQHQPHAALEYCERSHDVLQMHGSKTHRKHHQCRTAGQLGIMEHAHR
jgi:hypothetical protein